MIERGGVERGRVQEEAHRRAGAREVMAGRFGDRQIRRETGERLPQDAGEEPGGGTVGRARTHADRGKAQGEAVDHAFPGEVVDQKLGHQLLRAVARRGLRGEIVRDAVGEGGAEDRHRGCEDKAGVPVARPADRLEQRTASVEVDAVALVEIHLGLAGDDRRKVEDDVGPPSDARPASPGGSGGTVTSTRCISVIACPPTVPSAASRAASFRPIIPAAPITSIRMSLLSPAPCPQLCPPPRGFRPTIDCP